MVYYPIKEDPNKKRRKSTGPSERLNKNYIRAVLQELQSSAPHVYTCLEKLPVYRFAIVRYYDYVRIQIRPDTLLESDSLAIHTFLQYFELLHPADKFQIRFYTEICSNEQEFTVNELKTIYQHYLKYLSKMGLQHE